MTRPNHVCSLNPHIGNNRLGKPPLILGTFWPTNEGALCGSSKACHGQKKYFRPAEPSNTTNDIQFQLLVLCISPVCCQFMLLLAELPAATAPPPLPHPVL